MKGLREGIRSRNACGPWLARFCAGLLGAFGFIGVAAGMAAGAESPRHFYYYRGEPIVLELERQAIAIWASGRSGKELEADLRELGHEELGLAADWGEDLFLFTERDASGTPKITGDVEALVEELARTELGFVTPLFAGTSAELVVVKPRISVRFEAGTSFDVVEGIVAPYGTVLERDWFGMRDVYLLEPETWSALEVMRLANALHGEERVLRAAPRLRGFGPGPSTGYVPSDPWFGESWGLDNLGQLNASLPDLDVNGPEVWDLPYGSSVPFTGSQDVVLLVLDTGVQHASGSPSCFEANQVNHPDLTVWRGDNFTTQIPNCGGRPQNRCDNHGTWVAGVAAAQMEGMTPVGSVGVAPGARLASARVFGVNLANPDGDCGSGTAPYAYDGEWLIAALDWAPEFGPGSPPSPLPRVVTNLSANEYALDEDLEDKYYETWLAGMVHFISAGNKDSWEPAGDPIEYPAGIPGTNAVTNLSWAGPPPQLHIPGQNGGSRFGPGVMFTAPGTRILTTDRTGDYGACPQFGLAYCIDDPETDGSDLAYLTGTSFASPKVAGVAALVLSVAPNLPSGGVEWVMRVTATDLGTPGLDDHFGWGLPRADAAVELAVRMIFYDDFELGGTSRWSDVEP